MQFNNNLLNHEAISQVFGRLHVFVNKLTECNNITDGSYILQVHN